MTTHAIMPTYGRLDVEFIKGEGCWLIDKDGRRYLDALSGLGVVALGHAHPAIADAISAQGGALLHTSNLYRIPNQERLADRLAALSGMENMFFSNTGAEACECAIKIARLYGHQKGIAEPAIIVADNAFHGRTMATLTATGNRKVQAGFEPLVSGFVRVPFNDLESIKQAATHNQNIVAVFIEPIQGEGGIQVADQAYLQGLRALCDDQDWLLMIDEVQSGNGRTGQFFSYQHADILPDVVTTAKGLANGVPIGVCLAANQAAHVLGPGNHGSTFGGNPLSCAAAHAVLDVFEHEQIVSRAASMGQYLRDKLASALQGVNGVKEIRGQGLMIGIELEVDCAELVGQALEEGLLINVTAGSVVRLLPPLILSEEEADQISEVLGRLIKGLS
ncbi:MAG: aspartate aminotransferase family protein [Gammaproteobacteria bacterium]|jgi:acetylornithine/N-succinyldiaminopimelate aminotransferase|nr:aspartate aminotransferase family protein [Gammaproteobacteria bacterium]